MLFAVSQVLKPCETAFFGLAVPELKFWNRISLLYFGERVLYRGLEGVAGQGGA
jgi:hypothetical protein